MLADRLGLSALSHHLFEEDPQLRMLLIAALAALTSIALAAAAIAQDPDVSQSVSVSPSKTGSKSKPRAVKIKTFIKNNVPSTTASKIDILFPGTVKISGEGLTACPAAEFSKPGGKANCKSTSKAGSGVSHAVVGPQRAPLNFNVTAYVGGDTTVIFYIEQIGGSVTKALIGKISRASGKYRQKLSIAIPADLQQPAPGLYGALTDLTSTLYNTKRDRSLISTTDCKDKKHSFGSKLAYAPNPAPPPQPSATGSTTARCSG
ncbi:MAG TPA: hypothetical protein VES79_12775 [Solirubrobacteraceae bacterium]|nr:hypothetical protein [Solirubrobacteraceae bacterium]